MEILLNLLQRALSSANDLIENDTAYSKVESLRIVELTRIQTTLKNIIDIIETSASEKSKQETQTDINVDDVIDACNIPYGIITEDGVYHSRENDPLGDAHYFDHWLDYIVNANPNSTYIQVKIHW